MVLVDNSSIGTTEIEDISYFYFCMQTWMENIPVDPVTRIVFAHWKTL